MPKIRDVMETVPYTCPHTATVRQVIRQLADVQVGGLPIVDEKMRLVGYISDADITSFVAHKKPQVFDWGDMMPVIIDEEPIESKVQELLDANVMQVANKERIYAEVDQELDEVADLFKEHRIRKVAVLDGDKVVGVVTRTTILRYILTMMLPDGESAE